MIETLRNILAFIGLFAVFGCLGYPLMVWGAKPDPYQDRNHQ